VVAHDAKRLGDSVAFPVGLAAKRRDLAQNVCKQVGLVHAFFAGEHADGALKPHAGIHVHVGQRFKRAVLLFVVLHEHVVPDFQIPPAGAGGRAIRPAGLAVGNHEHLAVRPTGAGQARRAPPVVLFGQVENALGGHAAAAPQRRALLIAGAIRIAREHGKREALLGQAKVFGAGQKLPAPRDHLFFEVVAQRPVAQHLKKREMAEIAHIVDIASAHALLNIGKPGAGRVFRAHQVGHQRVHARGGKQHRGVVFRNQRRAGNHGVALILKKLEKHRAQFGGSRGFHGILSSIYRQS